MCGISSHIDPGELRERRTQIHETVKYLRHERFEIEENAQWMDAGAYRRRISLLECLDAWYDDEMAKINEALERLGGN